MSRRAAAALRANIFGRLGADHARVVLVAPFTAGDDGATVAMKLAESLAAAGQETVLVELPGTGAPLHAHYNVPAEPGLAEALRAGAAPTLQSGVGGVEGLKLVVEGAADDDADDLSASTAASDYLTRTRDSGVWVVALTGPASESPSALTLAPACDGIVLVATDGRTDRAHAAAVAGAMESVNATVLGVVMGPTAAGSDS